MPAMAALITLRSPTTRSRTSANQKPAHSRVSSRAYSGRHQRCRASPETASARLQHRDHIAHGFALDHHVADHLVVERRSVELAVGEACAQAEVTDDSREPHIADLAFDPVPSRKFLPSDQTLVRLGK